MNTVLQWMGGIVIATAVAIGGGSLAGEVFAEDARQKESSAPNIAPAEMDIPDDIADNAAAGPAATVRMAEPEQADGPFVIKRVLPINGPIRYGEWFWDDEGIPDGPLVMTVDLEARVMSVFRGGYEIGAAAVLLGTDDHPTPLGTFPIRYKMRHNVSEKYNNAPMPYSMFLTADGVAIHGSEVENGYASHGCIGTPEDFAAKVFAVAEKGDRVVITRGKRIGMGDPII